MATKVKVFTSGADYPDAIEEQINGFIEENNAVIKDLKFNASYFYNSKDNSYDGGFAALLIYEEGRPRSK